eukprot:CAMPEP_0172701696 /NCGR_PEP_ID=MMETSP1074-20121228/31814_1 /TAXON_ID=2916 /ORGANISM="Ceratium fusus, Strain PA161109" /LENGTH=466 /DNA_ID=CAMNT_0013523273 /DNA_START=78 /DNA_END=1473 /DNA_ORIENTATION=-
MNEVVIALANSGEHPHPVVPTDTGSAQLVQQRVVKTFVDISAPASTLKRSKSEGVVLEKTGAMIDLRTHAKPDVQDDQGAPNRRKPSPGKAERDILKQRPIRFKPLDTEGTSWVQDCRGLLENEAPHLQSYVNDVEKTLQGMPIKRCSTALINYKDSDDKDEQCIGLIYSADFTGDGLIVTDHWVLPKFCRKEIFHEIGRWWLIRLASRFSVAEPSEKIDHQKDNPFLKYKTLTLCAPLAKSPFRDLQLQVQQSFCFQAACEAVKKCLWRFGEEHGLYFHTHDWLQWGPFSVDDFREKADAFWPTCRWKSCNSIIQSPALTLSRPVAGLSLMYSQQHEWGTLSVRRAREIVHLQWDAEEGLQLDVSFVCSATYASFAIDADTVLGYLLAVITLKTKVYESPDDFSGDWGRRAKNKFTYRNIVEAKARMERVPESCPPIWKASLQLLPRRADNQELFSDRFAPGACW